MYASVCHAMAADSGISHFGTCRLDKIPWCWCYRYIYIVCNMLVYVCVCIYIHTYIQGCENLQEVPF